MQHLLQLVVVEAEAAVAELGAHPFFLVGPQIQHQHTPSGRRQTPHVPPKPIVTFPFSGQASTKAYTFPAFWTKRMSCAV